MSPEPYVRAYAAVLSLLLIGGAVLAPAAWTLALSGTSASIVTGLYLKYRRDVTIAKAPTPRHRERLDLIVAGDARAALTIGLVSGGLILALDITPPETAIATATPVLLMVVCAAIYLSSLVDWFVILPRISGQLGPRPCKSEHTEHPSFPRTWRDVTRWWYVHRIAAAIAVRFGLSFAVTATLASHISFPGGTAIVGAIVVAGFASYRAAAFRAFFEVGHPTFIVGDTVHHSPAARRLPWKTMRIRKVTVSIPGLKREPAGPLGPREYVFDVALEGVQLVRAASREKEPPREPDGTLRYVRRPRKIQLKNIGATEPAETPFSGCANGCAGINWYCIDNPDCYRGK